MKNSILELLIKNDYKLRELPKSNALEKYVDKILKLATVIPYYMENNLCGFIAYYCNDPQKQKSFLTLLFVDKKYRGNKLGDLLLSTSIEDLKNKGFETYELEVYKDNLNALSLYKKYGFQIISEDVSKFKMNLQFFK